MFGEECAEDLNNEWISFIQNGCVTQEDNLNNKDVCDDDKVKINVNADEEINNYDLGGCIKFCNQDLSNDQNNENKENNEKLHISTKTMIVHLKTNLD